MIYRPRHSLIVPVLALSITLASAASVHAQYRDNQRSSSISGTLQVNFGSAPHWMNVSGTQVQVIRQDERPDYDLFQYNNRYYAYDNDRWYSSDQWRGSFTYIDARSVPVALREVPRDNWRRYPSDWQDRADQNRNDRGSSGTSASLQVNFGSAPHWMNVGGTQVQVIRQDERPDYDLFRYNNRYYAFDNDQWYSSDQWRGSFTYIDARSVPVALREVPRDNWRRYPSDWQDRNGPDSRGASSSIQISFNRRPRWYSVYGTRVMELRQVRGQNYDMFRYGDTYYVYSDSRWYSSNRWDGSFASVDERSVPRELAMVPRNHWHNYPQEWASRQGDQRDWGHDRRRRY